MLEYLIPIKKEYKKTGIRYFNTTLDHWQYPWCMCLAYRVKSSQHSLSNHL